MTTKETARECRTCKVEKPLDAYRVIRNNPLRQCRECDLEQNRNYMRAYRKQRTAEKRAQRLETLAANPVGRPSIQQEIDAINIKVDAILAILESHGYNTTET
jgi:hypothetical protein